MLGPARRQGLSDLQGAALVARWRQGNLPRAAVGHTTMLQRDGQGQGLTASRVQPAA